MTCKYRPPPPPPPCTSNCSALGKSNKFEWQVCSVKTEHCQSSAFIFCETGKILHSDNFSQLYLRCRNYKFCCYFWPHSQLVGPSNNNKYLQQLDPRPVSPWRWKRLNLSPIWCWSSTEFVFRSEDCCCQLSNAIKNQLGHPKIQQGHFLLLTGSLWHKG